MAREIWDSRKVFLFATIASTFGLVSLWRMPQFFLEYGGLTYLIPYILGLIFIGVPLLMFEFTIGQKYKTSALSAFSKIHPKLRGLGIAQIFIAAVMLVYLTIILSWTLIYVAQSFQAILPWSYDAQNHFYMNVLELSKSPDSLGNVLWHVFLAALLVWIMVYAFVKNGIVRIQKNIKWLLLFPVSLILLLFLYTLTLPNAIVGMVHMFSFNPEQYLSIKLWLDVLSQIIISLTLSVGVMIAYASHNDPKQNIKNDAYLTVIISTILSLVLLLIIFGLSGFMEYSQPNFEGLIVGPGLFFATVPHSLTTLPFAHLASALFFLTMCALGLTTILGIMHSISLASFEKLKTFSKPAITLFVSSLCFIFSFAFMTQAGYYYIDVVDHFIASIAILLITAIQIIVILWFVGANTIREYVNQRAKIKIQSWWNSWVTYIIPFILVFALILQIYFELNFGYNAYPFWLLLIGWTIVLVPILILSIYAIFERA
jgi:neurotransmitter:Na+ symporter, NSS family